MRSGMDKYLLKSMQPLELVETIRTVHRGGTLIDRGMSHKLVAQLETDNGGDDPSLIKATSAYKKLGVRDREEAVQKAREAELLE